LFVGRDSESKYLAELLVEARQNQSRVLVIRGAPGIGKTELVASMIASTEDWRIVRTLGVEAEAELPFAALHQLCGPWLALLGDLPVPQRNALGAAFGLVPGTGAERFLVGLATLSLLSALAQEEPLICIVDDAHWLDRESAQVLGFVARRLSTDPIVMIFVTREYSNLLDGLPQMILEGLSPDESEFLLSSAMDEQLNWHARKQLLEVAKGNPLALLELPKGLTSTELSVGFGATSDLPLSQRIEETFGRRIDHLTPESQLLLTLAAADQLGDAATLWRAAEFLGLEFVAEPQEISGLLTIDTSARFRHPLVRSAAYSRASYRERQFVHSALAGANDPEIDPDRRAWHLAAATEGFDENIAAELERSASRAQERSGVTAAAAFLQRSADLTSDPELRAIRLLMAGAAYLESGAIDQANECLRRSSGQLVDPFARAQAMRMEGGLRFFGGRGGETPSLLFRAAEALHEIDPLLANETMLEAFDAALWAADLMTGTTFEDMAKSVGSWPEVDQPDTAAALLLKGLSERLTGSYRSAVQAWNRSIETRGPDAKEQTQWEQLFGWSWTVSGDMLDFENHISSAREHVRRAREVGALSDLPSAILQLAWSERLAGRLEAASALNDEAKEISSATGMPEWPGANGIIRLGVLCWQGNEQVALELSGPVAAAAERGQGLTRIMVEYGLATLQLGLGRYREARDHAWKVFDADPLYLGSLVLADLVEAAARSNDLVTAMAAVDRLSTRAEASGAPWALGLLARARALIASDDKAEDLYGQSIDHLAMSGVRTDLARSQLLFGEWLRRQRRRKDAREHLQTALHNLRETGAGAFANRAEIELAATGERARVRVDETRSQLTPQELQVAQLAAERLTNPEIAAQLFISSATVDYHLRKAFRKLNIGSRRELKDSLRSYSSVMT
jgi:DNA-binding CsgD family transcriptional regulator